MSRTTHRRRLVRYKKQESLPHPLLPGMEEFAMPTAQRCRYYERLLTFDPTCSEAIQWLTRHYLIEAGRNYHELELREQQLARARQLLRRWPESRRGSLYYLMCSAVASILGCELDPAAEAQLLERAISQFKPHNDLSGQSNADFLFRLCAAYYHRGRAREAEKTGSGLSDLEAAYMLIDLAVRIFPTHRGYRRHMQTIAALLQKTRLLDVPAET